MRKNIGILFTCLIFVIVQESFLFEFFGASLNPNLIIAFCFSFMLMDDYEGALFTAFMGGLFHDFLGVGIVGLSSMILVLALVFSQWVKKTIFRGMWVQALFIVGFTVVYKLLVSLPDINYSFKVLMSGFLNVGLSLLLFSMLKKFKVSFLSTEYRIKA